MNYTLQFGFEHVASPVPEPKYQFSFYISDDDDPDHFITQYHILYELVGKKLILGTNRAVKEMQDLKLFLSLIGESLEHLEREAEKYLTDYDVLDHVFWVHSLDILTSLKNIDVYYDNSPLNNDNANYNDH